LNSPLGVAVDAAGNVYIADTGNNVVRKVSGGVITTVAGNGTAGPTVGGPATGTLLYPPSAVAIDGAGGIYVATNYTYQTVTPFFNMPVTVTVGQVWKVRNDLIALSSTFSGYIGGLAVDPSGKLLAAANGIWVDASGATWIADTGNDQILKVIEGVTTMVAGAGLAPLQRACRSSAEMEGRPPARCSTRPWPLSRTPRAGRTSPIAPTSASGYWFRRRAVPPP
jgi:sugar lactone lactonase YvrE